MDVNTPNLGKQSDIKLSFIFLVEIIKKSDHRINAPDWQQAILEEPNGLRKLDVFVVVHERDVSNVVHVILCGKLIVVLKNVDTSEDKKKRCSFLKSIMIRIPSCIYISPEQLNFCLFESICQ